LLLARLEPRREPHRQILEAVRLIRARRGGVTVQWLASQVNLSISQLERIQPSHGTQGIDGPKSGRAARRLSKAGRRQHKPLDEILNRVQSIDSQLPAISQPIGADRRAGDLGQPTAQARQGKEAVTRKTVRAGFLRSSAWSAMRQGAALITPAWMVGRVRLPTVRVVAVAADQREARAVVAGPGRRLWRPGPPAWRGFPAVILMLDA
jgi:hypothetical protein